MVKKYFTEEERKAAHRKQAYDSFLRKREFKKKNEILVQKKIIATYLEFKEDEKLTKKEISSLQAKFDKKLQKHWCDSRDFYIEKSTDSHGAWREYEGGDGRKHRELTDESIERILEFAKMDFFAALEMFDFIDEEKDAYFVRHYDKLIASFDKKSLTDEI
jgi:hypothetical protein